MNPESKKRVLIADDESSMRTTLADILEDSGFEVSTAQDGLSAVKMCTENDYDVVLMDVQMPGIDGVEALQRLRKNVNAARVVLMSAYGDDELKHFALQQGAIAFLDKPLNLDTVIKLIADSSAISIIAVTNDVKLAAQLPSSLTPTEQKLTVVSSPEDALNLVSQLGFDVALIDTEIQTPINGLDCYLAMRKLSPEITAIMVSSTDEDHMQLAEEAVKRTAYTVITKPLQPKTLADMIRQLKAQRVSGSIRKPDSDNT